MKSAVASLTPTRFTPDSALWRVHREWLLCLSASRALLLELAHPLIAAGVAEHSNYRGDPFGRLTRTLMVMTQLSFGAPPAARRAGRQFHGCHRKVTGALTQAVGPFPAGTPYDADDPFLRLWVLATLIDSNLLTYDLLIRPLSDDERAAYYRDCQTLAKWFGLSPALMPATFDDFRAYMQAMIQSDLLTVSDAARDIVRALHTAPVFGPLVRVASWPGHGLLPPHLREAFGLQWSEAQSAWLRRLAAFTRRARPLVPDLFALNPLAWRRERYPAPSRA
jgi:uncharacterized protein (DUF2236 family)